MGAFIVALTSVILLPFCASHPKSQGKALGGNLRLDRGPEWNLQNKIALVFALTVWGGLGSLLDSALGGWFQASVVDKKTGKVIEGHGGKKVNIALL